METERGLERREEEGGGVKRRKKKRKKQDIDGNRDEDRDIIDGDELAT